MPNNNKKYQNTLHEINKFIAIFLNGHINLRPEKDMHYLYSEIS